MTEKRTSVDDRTTKRIRWVARVWGTVIVAVTLMILIGYAWNLVTTGTGDPYAVEGYPPIENLPPLFALLSAVGLALAWRWEGVGGAIALLFCLASLPVLLVHWPIARDFPSYLLAPYGTWLMITIPGVLFLICWQRSRKRAVPEHGA